MGAARAAGFDNVSLDLIFAVPGQSLAAWDDDLGQALALAPDHVSAYALTWEEGTPFHTWRARGRLVAVEDDVESAMCDVAAERLGAAGLRRYEISSWARAGLRVASQHAILGRQRLPRHRSRRALVLHRARATPLVESSGCRTAGARPSRRTASPPTGKSC